jgi:hypothetical protein
MSGIICMDRTHMFITNVVYYSIFYKLSDVQYGGAVVFPKLNLTVPVQKVNSNFCSEG